MNLMEAGVLPAIPIGGIIGGVLCKTFGTLATIGGVLVGIIAGGFIGWCYAFLVLFLLAVIATLWNAISNRPTSEVTEEESANISSTARLPVILSLIGSTIVGFKEVWYHGLILAGILTIVIAFTSVALYHLRTIRQKREND